jgi:hypothetical protein
MKCWLYDYINLLPIGNIKITEFKDLVDENTIYLGAINKGISKKILNPADVNKLRKKMVELNTELLTDGHDFYLLDNNFGVYEVAHYRFTEIYNQLGWSKINQMMIDSADW